MAIISNRNKISTAGYRSIRESEFLRDRDKLQADIQSLFADYDTLYKQDSERGGGIDVYRTDSSAWYDNVSGLDSSLQAKADDVLKRVEYYKNYIDPEYYNNLTKSIGNIKSNGSSILANAQSMKDFYSNFKDEASYNEWLTQYKEHQALLGYDLTSAKNEIDTLKTQLDNITQGKPENFTTEAHELAKQYEEKVAYYGKAEQAQESLPFLTESKYEKFAEGVVPLYADLIVDAASKGYINKGQNDFVKYQFLTPDEKRIYQGYWVNGEYKKANDYYNKILPDVEKRIASGFSQMSEIPGFRSIASVGTTMLAGVEGAGNMINYLSGQTNGLDKSVFAEGTSILRQGAAEDLGKFGGFVYNAAMSGVDSITANALLGPAGGAIMLGANAASSATNDALDRGMPEGKALQYGLVAGVFETLFENVSLGSLDKLKQSGIPTWEAYGKEVAKQIGVNASEETFTEIGTIMYDSIVNGKYSTYAKLREEGKSPIEAIGSLGLDVLEAGASGALMGAGFGAVGGLKAKNNYNSFYDSVAGKIAGSGYTGDINLLVSALYKKQLADAGAGEIQSVNEREQSELDNYDKFVNNNRSRYELKGYLNTLKVGENGMTEAASIDIGDRDTSEIAKAFALRYQQGVKGNEIGGFNSPKYSILSENEQRIAYNAGKMDAIERKIAEGAKTAQESAKVEAPKTAKATTKQSSTTVFSTSSNVSSEIAKIDNAKMREYAKSFKLGVEGVKSYGSLKNDEQGVGQYTEDFVRAYNAGKNGSDISRVPHGSLTDAQRQIAYNSGKMDALKSKSEAKVNSEMRDLGQTYRFGKEGIKAYRSIIKDNQNVGKYTEDFVKAYNAGKKGVDLSRVGLGSLTDTQRRMAYNAGKADAMQKSEATFKSTDESTSTVTTKATSESKAAAKATKIFSSGEKVTVADEASLTDEQKTIRANAKKLGINIIFGDVRTKNGKAANGLIDKETGDIYISTVSKKAIEFVTKHELTHYLENVKNVNQYFDLMNAVFDSDTFKKWYEDKGFKNLAGMTSNKISEYRNGGIKLDEMGAKKEILADFVGEMLFGGENQISDNLFSELDDNHKKTFREWIGALIDRLKQLFSGNKSAENEITKLEAKFKEMLKESLKSEAPGETNTVSLNYSNEQRITSAMTDDERYEILKNKKISAPIYKGQADKYIEDEIQGKAKSVARKAVYSLAEMLGIRDSEINFSDIDVKVTLSKSNLQKSLSDEATPTQIAKLLPIIAPTAENSILIERHDNRYYYDTDTVYFDNLLGAYVDSEYLVPMRFGLKHSRLGKTTLYIVVDQNKIELGRLGKIKNDTGLRDPAPNLIGVSNLHRRVNYSISQIVQFVKSKDLLRYIPDNMLDDSQKTAKWEAIAETIIKTNNKNDKYFTEYIAKNDMRSAQQMVKAAARANGYIYSGYHGTKAKPFTVFKPSVTGVYLATNRQLAEDFATGWRGEKGTVYNLVAKIDKPFIVNEHTKTGVPFYFNIPTPSEMKNSGVTSEIVSTEEIAHWAQDNEYDGVIIDGIREGADVFTTDIIVFDANQIKSADPITYDDNGDIIPLSQRFNEGKSDIRFSYTPAIDEQELTRMARDGEISAEEYGRRMLEIKDSRRTEDPYAIARMNKEDLENPLPNLNRKDGEAKGDGQSKFYDSLQRSKLFDETFKKEVESDKFIEQYKTITNKETLAEAAKLLDEGGEDFVNTWFNKSTVRMSTVDTMVGFILLKRYQDIGNYNSAVAVAEKLREVGTRTGQKLQAFSILSRFTPEMMQVYAQKQLDKAFEEAVKGKTQKWIDKNKSKFELTEEDIDYIRTRTIQAAYLPNGSRDQAIRLAEITARLQDKIPPSFSTSWKTWQRMSMLFNPKTHLRNIAGNGIIAPAFVASDWFGTPVDILLSKFTGKRTTGLTGVMGHNKADLAEALKGASEAYDDFLRGINTKIEFDKFKIDGAGKGFNEQKYGKMARVFNNIDSFNSFLLTAEDALFYKMWFMNSLNNQKKLNNVSEATLEMIEIAQQEALQRTWQDNNVATKAVGAIKKVLNLDFMFKNEATGETYNPYQRIFRGYGFGDVFIKFVKTPANLTKAIYDFSPAGFASVAAKSVAFSRAVKKGTVSAKLQKDLVNSIGKAISGTLLYLMFGAMYSAGWITGKGDDDKDVAAFEKYVQGAPEYAIKIGKKWWSYDWAQPVGAIPAIISNGREAINEKDGAFQAVLEAISAGGDVLFDQSFMSSIQQMFSSTNFFGNLASAILNEITVPIPTLLSQTANAFDEKRRTTYDSQSSIRTAINKFKQKIPGLRNTLEVERDILGRETPNSQKNILNAFFNPMNTFTDTSTAVTDHVYELYQSTGKASAIPSKAPYDVTIKGVKHTFSIEERNEYQRIMGETSAQIIGELINNDSYMALTDEQKLEVIKSVYSYAQSLAKSEMGLAESYDVISGIRDITEDEYNALSDEEIKAIADDYVLSSYYSISDFDSSKKATWFVNKSLPTAVNAAIKSGDMAKAQKLIKSVEANVKSLGLPTKEAKEMIKKSQASIKSEITNYWKEKFIEAHKRGDNGEKIRIKKMLVDTGLYGNSADVRDLTNGWKKEK